MRWPDVARLRRKLPSSSSNTDPYEFWIDEPRPEYADRNRKRRVARGNFENDEQAVEWFKANYPDEYKHGVEMRVWDQ